MDMGTPAPPPPTGADAHGGHAPAPQKK
jgi:hypothetical protein